MITDTHETCSPQTGASNREPAEEPHTLWEELAGTAAAVGFAILRHPEITDWITDLILTIILNS